MDNMDIGFVPVPSPGAVSLLALGGLVASRRRRG
jgi:MYXO-CTERM domain-containing protein